jgi:hypothetical protein
LPLSCDTHNIETINFSRARKSLKPHVGDVEAAAVPCGLGRAIGNKVNDDKDVHELIFSSGAPSYVSYTVSNY